MRRQTIIALMLTPLLLGIIGCKVLSAAAQLIGPERMQDPHFTLTTEPIAIVIDGFDDRDYTHTFKKSLHDKTSRLLADADANKKVVSYTKMLQIRQQKSNYTAMSIQEIGKCVGAEQVVYIRLTKLDLIEAAGVPVLSPKAVAKVKVIDCNKDPEAPRLWPETRQGYEVEISRQPREADSAAIVDAEARKLGSDLAQYVARLFYRHSLEEDIPQEH